MKCGCKIEPKKLLIQNKIFYQCKKCGLLWKDEMLPSALEKARYDLHICDEKYQTYMRGIYERIRGYLLEGKSLDYGCGKYPALAQTLAEEGIFCAYYDLYYFPKLPKDRYANILLIEVFEHLRNPIEELKFIANLLEPKGRVILMTKPYDEKNLDNWWYLRDVTHICFIRKDTLKYWDIPFEVIEQSGDIFVLERI